MAIVKGTDVSIQFKSSGTYYNLQCSKDATITITQDNLELAPKTSHRYKRFIPNRISGTIQGSGVVESSTTYNIFQLQTLQLAGTDAECKFNVGSKTYTINCLISEISISSAASGFANFTYNLIINGLINIA
jgi:hypothetical protein